MGRTMLRTSPRARKHALRLSAVAIGVGLLTASTVARAQDDGDGSDNKTFEQKIIGDIMHGLGATNAEDSGIDYRERSPLVVPPKLDLPPPVSAKSEVTAPNWPKDPDVAARKAAIAAENQSEPPLWKEGQPLGPAQLNVGRTAAHAQTAETPVPPGQGNPMMSPSQLGYNGGLLGIFKGKSQETAQFKGEPPRTSLTEPPPGYQTPSPNYAYGSGPLKPLGKHLDVMSGKEVNNY
ncbi:MAG: hypothetical protein ACRECL_20485 [Bradyrhizobium sp.]